MDWISFIQLYNKLITEHFQAMTERHHGNKPSLHQKEKPNPFPHHRSFSGSRHHRRNISNLNTNFVTTDNYISNSITLPISIDYNKDSKYLKKSVIKQSQELSKKRSKVRSRQKQLTCLIKKDKKKKNTIKVTKSNEKVKQSIKKKSSELTKHKNSPIKIINYNGLQQKNRKNNCKKLSNQKLVKNQRQKNHEKSRSKKKLNNLEMGVNWQQIIEEYGYCLSLLEIAEIKQYKWIYFLGKIKERLVDRAHPHHQILSARGHHQSGIDKQQQQKLNQLDYFTQLKGQNEVGTSRREQTQDEFYKYETGDHIAYRYEIIDSINRGSFGEVIKVYDHKSKEYLALKIVKKCQQLVQQTFQEISILTQIKERDKANLSGVVRIKDFTIFRNHICIVFELLNGNLYELLAANNYNGLGQDIIRIFAVQILNSLQFLQREKVIHCDIKPQNIVMKTWGKSGIKLVDFGTSCFDGKQLYQYLQSRYYRAPQIMLRKPYSFPIDMWSFGCLLAELKIGEPIFAGTTNIQQLMYISNSIGFPKTEDGFYSASFLDSDEFKQLKQKDFIGQYKQKLAQGEVFNDHQLFSKCKYLKNCMETLKQRLSSHKKQAENSEFVDFIMKILVWQPSKRLKPEQALQDAWIIKGLPKQIKQLYTIFNSCESSMQYKGACKRQHPNSSRNHNSTKKSKQKTNNNQLSVQRRNESKSHKSKLSNRITKVKNGANHHKNAGGGSTFR